MSGAAPADARERSTKEFLRRLALFADLSDEDLGHLARVAQRIVLPAGTLLMEEGSTGDGLYVVVQGELEITKREGKGEVVLAHRGAGEVLGEMSLLGQTPRSASARAVRESELIVISPAEFEALLAANSAMALRMLQTVASRLRSTEAALMQREKLASLGTMAAGLAHELNNPAAAIARSSAQLQAVATTWSRDAGRLAALELDEDQAHRLDALRVQPAARAVPPPASASGELEDRISDWLEARGVREAWEIAPSLAAGGWDEARLNELAGGFTDEQVPAIIRYLAGELAVRDLLAEIRVSAQAISAIVRSVKTYTYLDQAPVQSVDVRQSLEDTFTILRHRLKHGVDVQRDYDSTLAPIEAYGSELNQVWTNLIDNAVDAMGGKGTIEVRTLRRGDDAVVEIVDDGPGIPAEIQPRIFEPFFTTKSPGEGTGLGLHLVYNIIVDRHRGRIHVTSRPGRTVFEVTLPIAGVLRRG